MFIGRAQELRQLEDAYRKEQSTAYVLYGRYGIGKTELALHFTKDKPVIYYAARELSEREQCLCFARELTTYTISLQQPPSLYEMLKRLVLRNGKDKTVIVLDEFQYLVKSGNMLAEVLQKLLQEVPCMLILLSSSVNWVENGMVEDMQASVRSLTGILKCKEFNFIEMVNRFPKLTVEQTIIAYAVLGGVPRYLDYWQENQTLEENMLCLFFRPDAPLFTEAESFLRKELRELGAYNTILAALASGKNKLNDIYERTGFSRAKISVYIKNLIELDVVEKVFSFDSQEKAFRAHKNAQKGLYRIKDSYLRFWYRYIFPNMSMILSGRGEEAGRTVLNKDFSLYMRECFSDVCNEFLHLMSQHNRLTTRYNTWGSWYGKTGRIDIVAGDGEGHILAGFCRFDHRKVSPEDLEEYQELLALAQLVPTELYLFSKEGFTDELKAMPKQLENGAHLALVGLEDL